MEKVISIGRRAPGMTREAYYDHYTEQHIPIGMRQTGFEGYTVNFVESGGIGIDSVTEDWVQSAADFISGKTFLSPDDREAIFAHSEIMCGPRGPGDGRHLFVLAETVVVDGPLGDPGEGPWAKTVSLYRTGEDPGEPPAGAYRVVENRVVETFTPADQAGAGAANPSEPLPPQFEVALFRMVWATDPAALAAPDPATMHVRERRVIVLAS